MSEVRIQVKNLCQELRYYKSRIRGIYRKNALLTQMDQTDKELEQAQGEFLSLLKDLTSTDETIMSSLNELIRKMEG